MTSLKCLLLSACIVAFCTSCSRPAPVEKAEKKAAEESSAFRIYVTNEVSGDLTVIDSATYTVIATGPLGKRPRGIHASPDRKTIYVALSGSPIAGPDVDESTLPPPDKSADGIGVFDVAQNKVVRVIKGGSDPENFDVSKDGTQLFISNEDDEAVSVVDVASGTVVKSAKVGAQPEGVKVTPDGKLVYVTSEETGTISVLDPAAGKILKTFKVGHRPRSVAFMPDDTKAYINAENDGTVVLVDAVKQEMIKPISLGKPGVIKPMAVLLSPDSTKLYVSTGRGHQVFTIDTATNTVAGSVEVGPRPWGIALRRTARRSTRPTDLRTTSPSWTLPPTLSPRRFRQARVLGVWSLWNGDDRQEPLCGIWAAWHRNRRRRDGRRGVGCPAQRGFQSPCATARGRARLPAKQLA
jgi:YVTN family beta-propeller protein